MNEMDEQLAYLMECATGQKWITREQAEKEKQEAIEKAEDEQKEAAAAKAKADARKQRGKDIVSGTGKDIAALAGFAIGASQIARGEGSSKSKTKDILNLAFGKKRK